MQIIQGSKKNFIIILEIATERKKFVENIFCEKLKSFLGIAAKNKPQPKEGFAKELN